MIDAEVYDDTDSAAALNEIAVACSRCGSRSEPLVALVRFVPIDIEVALCGACYQSLSDRALGRVV